MAEDNRQLDAYVHDVRPRFEEMLGQAVESHPSAWIPRTPPTSGGWRNLPLTTFVMPERKLTSWRQTGYPIVSGGWTKDPAYPTVTIYNHMDVQPAQEPNGARRRSHFGRRTVSITGVEPPTTRVRR